MPNRHFGRSFANSQIYGQPSSGPGRSLTKRQSQEFTRTISFRCGHRKQITTSMPVGPMYAKEREQLWRSRAAGSCPSCSLHLRMQREQKEKGWPILIGSETQIVLALKIRENAHKGLSATIDGLSSEPDKQHRACLLVEFIFQNFMAVYWVSHKPRTQRQTADEARFGKGHNPFTLDWLETAAGIALKDVSQDLFSSPPYNVAH